MSIEKIAKLIKKGDNQKIAQQLQNPSININQLDPKSGKTLLQLSIQNYQFQIFKLILKSRDIKLDTQSKSGQTALQAAILINSPQYIDQLLRTKSPSLQKNPPKQSIMYLAIKNKTNPQIIKKLIHHNFDINQHIPSSGSLLNLAITSDQFQNFSILLDHPSINLTAVDDQQNTPLLLSTKLKKAQFVEAIIKKLQNIDPKKMSIQQKSTYIATSDQNGDTALHVAARKDYQNIIDIITKQTSNLSIDLAIKNKQGKTYNDLRQQLTSQKQKCKQSQQYQQKKRAQQRKIKQKQKQQQRLRISKQQQVQRQQRKKKNKQQQLLQNHKKKLQAQMDKSKTIWITVIAIIVVVGVMYLAFLYAISNANKNSQLL